MTSRRVLIDTCLYVDWFRARQHADLISGRLGPPSLSAVVAMELLSGTRAHDRLLGWADGFRRSGRLLIPGFEVWTRAARVLRRLRARGHGAPALTNDVLIAMTARTAGLRLYTSNRRDFETIAAIEPFDLILV
jgi:predicted nucleic acid-binding protein